MFTDIRAAIEEARWLRQQNKASSCRHSKKKRLLIG